MIVISMVVLSTGDPADILTSSPVLPMMLPTRFWAAPVAESTYDLRVEVLSLLLADMMAVDSEF